MLIRKFRLAGRRHKYRGFAAALVASLAVHAAVIGALPGRSVRSAPQRVALTVELAQVLVAESRLPAEPDTAPGVRQTRRAAPRAESRSAPVVPREQWQAQVNAPPAGERVSPRAEHSVVESGTSAPEEKHAVRDPAPTRIENTLPAPGGDAFLAYRQLLARAIAARQSYPRLARLRGWQGTVYVELRIAAGNALRDALVTRSSGFDILDSSALEMVRQVHPLPAVPGPLRSREFSVTVPIAFRLTD